MIDCQGVHQVVASGEVEEFGFMKRMELKLHLMMCGHCRNYTDQIRSMGAAIRSLLQPKAGDDDLCDRMEHEILDGTGTDGDAS